jgi:RNA polymerase sigma-70 factor (ECF subfamily)
MSTAVTTPSTAGTRAGTPERWELLGPHRDRLIRLAASRFNAHEAEDVAHEALLRAYAFENLDDERVGSFLTSVTLRLCVDWHRASTRARRAYGRLRADAHHEGPEERVCDKLAGGWLMRLLDGLPARERSVLLARAGGLSTSETAMQLGITHKAAESAFTRGRAKLLVHAAVAA